MKKSSLLFAVLFIASFGFTQNQPDLTIPIPLDPKLRFGKLPNGMTYYVRYNAKPEKRAELRLAVNVGSTMENDNQQGLAHFTEHMCFNGTKNFKKNELIDYLESVGTKFGPHLNAFTSFDETVYMIQIPTDKEDIIQKGLQILDDWSQNLSFDTTEINKERGVVIEEWRLGLGAQERMRQKYFPVLFKDSRYATRLPIGKKDILQNCSYQTMIDFYKDWYRPDVMAVIAIGDFDLNKMEALIKDKFSKVPAKANPRKTVEWPVPDHKDPLAIVVSDKENSYTSIQLVYKQKEQFKPRLLGDYSKALAINLFNSMFNKRIDEIAQQPDAPFSFGYGYYSDYVRTKDAYVNWAIVQEKNIARALETFATENERVKRYGFTKTELERGKVELLRQTEQLYNERDKTESDRLIWEFVTHFLEGTAAEGIEKQFELTRQFLPLVSLEDVNALAKKWITDGENMALLVMAAEKEGVPLPDEKSLLSLMKKVQSSTITPYDDKVSDKPLMVAVPKSGSIISETKNPKTGITEWKLSNGARVVFKPTDFKNDEIKFSARSEGGSSLSGDPDYESAGNAAWIIDKSGVGDFNKTQLSKYLSGKIASVYPYIYNLEEGMRGDCSPQDLETLMQLIHLYFTQPRKDAEAFQSYINEAKSFIENQQLNPSSAFYDTIQCVMNSYHFRHRPQTIEMLNEINLDRAFDIYKDRFANAGDFTFYFVGNLDPNAFKTQVSKYLASLPSLDRLESWKDHNIQSPKGRSVRVVRKGIEPKSSVDLKFYGKTTYKRDSRYMMTALTKLLSIKLRETMREDKGAVYGVNVYGSLTHYPKEKFNVTIRFGCAPENVDMLIATALDEIEKVKQSGCDEKNLAKIKEIMKRENEVSFKENDFWIQTISDFEEDGEDISEVEDIYAFIEGLNSDSFKKACNTFFSKENYARFVLLPEK